MTPKPVSRPYVRFVRKTGAVLQSFGRNNPTFASSFDGSCNSGYAADGDLKTFWRPAINDKHPYLTVDTEKKLSLREVLLSFPHKEIYQYIVEISVDAVNWKVISDERNNQNREISKMIDAGNQNARFVRVCFKKPENAALAEVEMTGEVL